MADKSEGAKDDDTGESGETGEIGDSGAGFMSAVEFGHSLRGLGVNLLVREIAPMTAFLASVLEVRIVHADRDFAVLERDGRPWMLHADHTYHSNPLLGLVGDDAVRGAGAEFQVYGVDPDAAEARAREQGYTVLQPAKDKPHGLREAYLVGPDHYVWVPSMPIEV